MRQLSDYSASFVVYGFRQRLVSCRRHRVEKPETARVVGTPVRTYYRVALYYASYVVFRELNVFPYKFLAYAFGDGVGETVVSCAPYYPVAHIDFTDYAILEKFH